MAHIRQSRPDPGLVIQAQVLKTSQSVLASLRSGRSNAAARRWPRTSRALAQSDQRFELFPPRSFFVVLSSLEMSATRVYEPYTRALLGTALQVCEAVQHLHSEPEVVHH